MTRISILAVLFITALSTINAFAQTTTYKDKEEILRASREQDEWCTMTGSTTFHTGGKEYYALYKDCSSGVVSTNVFIYAAEALVPDQKWHLVYQSGKFAGRVKVEMNEIEQQVVFLSTDRKKLLGLPVAQLNK